MVLTHLCHRSNFNFSIAHCNFRLRGKDSALDEHIVADLANKLHKKYYVTHFDTIGYANKNKVSIQMAARELRYHWFTEILEQNKLEKLVTAHHAHDSLETFLINLSRGTGLDGLLGIPEENGSICRPLLIFPKDKILDFAIKEKLEWREDKSNQELKYLRNRIRLKVVPELEELHPFFFNNFLKTQKHLKDSVDILENHIASVRSSLFRVEGKIIKVKIDQLRQLKPLKGYLFALFKEYGFSEWEDVANLLNTLSGKVVASKTHRLVRDRDDLLLQKLPQPESHEFYLNEANSSLTEPFALEIQEVEDMGERDKNVLYVDKETLKYPLVLRKWIKGDYFYPIGMMGRKKVSKFFKDQKFSLIEKENQWLLCSDNKIVWVVAERADDRFKVKESTKNIMRFKCQP